MTTYTIVKWQTGPDAADLSFQIQRHAASEKSGVAVASYPTLDEAETFLRKALNFPVRLATYRYDGKGSCLGCSVPGEDNVIYMGGPK